MTWTRLRMEVRTPLFGGDDPGGSGTPIRVPSIRGVLRFWLRAVAAGRGVTDRRELWEAEQAVFGSTSVPSAITLRVPAQPVASGRSSTPEWANSEQHNRGFDGAQYLLGQGLWRSGAGLRRDFVEPGQTFALDVRFSRDPQTDARFMLALWAWLTYGGLGARTRRGFGQIGCTKVERGELPGGWRAEHLASPGDEAGWLRLGRAPFPSELPDEVSLGWGAPLALLEEGAEVPPLPAVPSLAPRWWVGCLLDGDATDLGPALHLAGLAWRWFRAGADPEGKPGPSTRSPEWSKVIHGSDQRYPVAALGLPVGYFSRSRGQKFSATVTPYLGDQPLRRASPVWLRPVRLTGGRWAVFTHVFQARLLPEGTELRITGGVCRTVPPPADPVVVDQWWNWIERNPRLRADFFPPGP